MTPLNFRQIYDRHQGPYVLLLVRQDAKGKQFTDRVTGSSLRAQAAHETAVDLITATDGKNGDVTHAFVFSDTEGQFIGALYRRGEAYAPWEHLAIDDAPRTTPKARRVATAPSGEEGTVTEMTAPSAPPKPPRVKTPGSRFPAMRGRALAMTQDADAKWPASKPAQMVKAHFEFKGPTYSATSPELVADIGPALKEIGVEFPASLISRLKQAGLLVEQATRGAESHEQASTEGDAPSEEDEARL